MIPPRAVIWHDAECGAYAADLPLWRELAQDADGTVLDIGAGTGRVALDLARRGHAVTALELEPELRAELERRAGELPVAAVAGDARDFALGRRFTLVIVPMQTIQILGGAEGRAAFLRCASEHLEPGGRLVAALTAPLESFEEGDGTELPVPDVGEHDGWVFASQPVAVRRDGADTLIERIRQVVSPDGESTLEHDVVRLEALDPATLEAEGEAAGLRPGPSRSIEPTLDHVGSTAVVLQAPGPQDHPAPGR